MNWYKYSSPAAFYPLAGRMIPWFAVPAVILFFVGLYVGFFVAPTDFQQGEAYRIMFIHVPAAWMGMLLYVLMAFYAGIGWAFNARLSSMMASALAITGAMFTVISLLTGVKVSDCTNGYRAIRVSELHKLNLREDRFNANEIILEALKHKLRFEQVPVSMMTRAAGETKKPPKLAYPLGAFRVIISTWLR